MQTFIALSLGLIVGLLAADALILHAHNRIKEVRNINSSLVALISKMRAEAKK